MNLCVLEIQVDVNLELQIALFLTVYCMKANSIIQYFEVSFYTNLLLVIIVY